MVTGDNETGRKTPPKLAPGTLANIAMQKFGTILLVFIFYFSCKGQNKYSKWFDLNLKNQPASIIEFNYYPLTELSDSEYSFYMDSSINYLTEWKESIYDTLGFVTKGRIKHHMDNEIIVFTESHLNKQFFKDSIILTIPGISKERIFLDEYGFVTKRFWESVGFMNYWYKRDDKHRIIETHSKGCGVDTCGESWTYFTLNEKGDVIKEIVKGIAKSALSNDSTFYETTYYSYVYDKYDNWILKTTEIDGKVLTISERKIKY